MRDGKAIGHGYYGALMGRAAVGVDPAHGVLRLVAQHFIARAHIPASVNHRYMRSFDVLVILAERVEKATCSGTKYTIAYGCRSKGWPAHKTPVFIDLVLAKVEL